DDDQGIRCGQTSTSLRIFNTLRMPLSESTAKEETLTGRMTQATCIQSPALSQ
ncbi:hypothetical protein IW146_010542, partial [Coemansia sp. RSA 922]